MYSQWHADTIKEFEKKFPPSASIGYMVYDDVYREVRPDLSSLLIMVECELQNARWVGYKAGIKKIEEKVD